MRRRVAPNASAPFRRKEQWKCFVTADRGLRRSARRSCDRPELSTNIDSFPTWLALFELSRAAADLTILAQLACALTKRSPLLSRLSRPQRTRLAPLGWRRP